MIQVILPAAGRGQRFADAGFKDPKPFIKVGREPMFAFVLDQYLVSDTNKYKVILQADHFDRYTSVLRDYMEHSPFDIEFQYINGQTEGAACTVLLGCEDIDPESPLWLTDVDHVIEDYEWFNEALLFFERKKSDGGLVCFLNDHPKWSYCQTNGKHGVTSVVEKQVVSPFSNTGDFYFAKAKYFIDAAQRMIAKNDRIKNEFYVSNVYNYMLADGMKVDLFLVNNMVGLGTPDDLHEYQQRAFN